MIQLIGREAVDEPKPLNAIGAFIPAIVAVKEVTVFEMPLAASPVGTTGFTAPRPVQYTRIVSPGAAGLDAETSEKSA